MIKTRNAFTVIAFLIVLSIICILATIFVGAIQSVEKERQYYSGPALDVGDKVYNEYIGLTGVVNQIYLDGCSQLVDIWIKDGTNAPVLWKGINYRLLARIPVNAERQ